MDFFEQQELRRRASRRLVFGFALAAALTVAGYCALAALFVAGLTKFATGAAVVPWQVPALIAAVAGASILLVSGYRLLQFRAGGEAVAEMLGARALSNAASTAERRLLNVVEEMAIAAGLTVPPVYVLEEAAVNALVAGHSPNEAVLVVTRGAIERLSRDELQGVIGHEMSHILNGDMALNLRLAGLLAGLTWLRDEGERQVHRSARQARGVPREKQGGEALAALAGALIAFAAFPGTLAASGLRAAVSREREFLADAASVQFTRNPDGIAGALDSIRVLRAHTVLLGARVEGLAHMFFAPAVVHWWGFPTHPPIAERIRRAHPRFRSDEYRVRRHGPPREYAVIDGAGNVVKHVGQGAGEVLASVGRPTAAHVALVAQLLQSLPVALRESLRDPPKAAQALLRMQGAGRLAAAELAIPELRAQPASSRERFMKELVALIQADGRVTLREFVLMGFLRQHLRPNAGRPVPIRYRAIADLAQDARAVLSLVAHAGGGDAAEAFRRGEPVLQLAPGAPHERFSMNAVEEALERLRHLAPLAKARVLKACLLAVESDGRLRLEEAELVRMIAAALDCPVPPLIPDAAQPGALSASPAAAA